jgi:CRP-like cAMP-binding protein
MRAGSAITVEGDASRGVHILCSGRAKFTTCSRGGRALIVRLAEAGEVIGLCDVIANRPFESNAITLEPAEVAFVSRADLSRLLGSYPAVRRAVAMELSNQYNAAYSEIRCLSRSRSAAHRLAAFLLQWFNRDNWSEMNLPLTHEELGELIGASRETVTRALSVFSRRGAVEARDGQVRLRNRAVLGSILGQ